MHWADSWFKLWIVVTRHSATKMHDWVWMFKCFKCPKRSFVMLRNEPNKTSISSSLCVRRIWAKHRGITSRSKCKVEMLVYLFGKSPLPGCTRFNHGAHTDRGIGNAAMTSTQVPLLRLEGFQSGMQYISHRSTWRNFLTYISCKQSFSAAGWGFIKTECLTVWNTGTRHPTRTSFSQ